MTAGLYGVEPGSLDAEVLESYTLSRARDATPAEAMRITIAKEGPCMACIVRLAQGQLSPRMVIVGCDYHHAKSGNRRRGHAYGFGMCIWHHRGLPLHDWTDGYTRRIYGPSLMDGSDLFHRTYGPDDELIELQTDWVRRNWPMGAVAPP